jgi:hypothetical protein
VYSVLETYLRTKHVAHGHSITSKDNWMIGRSGVFSEEVDTQTGFASLISPPSYRTVLHVGSGHQPIDTALLPVLFIGGLASSVLVTAGIIAFSRRQARSYLFVVLALGTLVMKALLGGLALSDIIPISQHHLIEHALDMLLAVFLLIAVYDARTSPSRYSNTGEQSETDPPSNQST